MRSARLRETHRSRGVRALVMKEIQLNLGVDWENARGLGVCAGDRSLTSQKQGFGGSAMAIPREIRPGHC